MPSKSIVQHCYIHSNWDWVAIPTINPAAKSMTDLTMGSIERWTMMRVFRNWLAPLDRVDNRTGAVRPITPDLRPFIRKWSGWLAQLGSIANVPDRVLAKHPRRLCFFPPSSGRDIKTVNGALLTTLDFNSIGPAIRKATSPIHDPCISYRRPKYNCDLAGIKTGPPHGSHRKTLPYTEKER